MKVIPVASNQVMIEAMQYNVKVHEGAYLRLYVKLGDKEIAAIKITDKGAEIDQSDSLLRETAEFVCPNCGEVANEKNGAVVISGKIGYKFTLLMVNSNVNKAVFKCDTCEEMFQIPTSKFIRIVR